MASASVRADQVTLLPPLESAHGSRPSDSTHRRVALQSPADLNYLINNVRRAARSKIDLHLPLEAAWRDSQTGGPDVLRKRVEEDVNTFIERVFDGVRQGVEINGIAGEEMTSTGDVAEEFEAYDTKLATRVANAYAKIEDLNVEIAEMRRKMAKEQVELFQTKWNESIDKTQQTDAKTLQEAENAGDTIARDGLFEDGRALPWAGRDADLQQTWEKAMLELNGLAAGLEQSKVQAEEARQAAEFIEGRPKPGT